MDDFDANVLMTATATDIWLYRNREQGPAVIGLIPPAAR